MPDSVPRPVRGASLLVARARAQAGLVAAVWAVVLASATVSATFALLLTAGNERALAAGVAAADGTAATGGADIATVVVGVADPDDAPPASAAVVVPAVKEAVLAAAPQGQASVSIWATTPLLFLPGDDVRRGYFLDADTAATNAALVAGDWPSAGSQAAAGEGAPTVEVAIATTTAAALGLSPGDELVLTDDRALGAEAPGAVVAHVVGVFEPSGSATWDRDLLGGQGYVPTYDWLPAYGPFLVAPGILEAIDAPIASVSAVLDPDLAGDASRVPGIVAGVAGIEDRVDAALGDAVRLTMVRSALGGADAQMRSELSLTNSLVLAVLLVVVALAMATVALVARVLSRRRAAESVLLRDRGASTPRIAGLAAAEATWLAVTAAVVAIPLALLGYAAVAGSPSWGEAWASAAVTAPGVGLVVVASALCGALAPSALVVVAALPERARRGRAVLSGPLARSGADVMLAAVGVVTYLQLRTHPVSPGAIDPLLVAAPAICAVALASVAARVIPAVARLANAAARRARGLTVPLAGWHLARGGAAQGTFLVVLAAAVASLSVSFLATWTASQGEQAEAIVGGDVTVHRTGGPSTGADLAGLTGGQVAPVADTAVVFGSRPDGVQLVAIPTAHAETLLHGRLGGAPGGPSPWPTVTAGLAPAAAAAPLELSDDVVSLTIEGGRRADDPTSSRPLDGELYAIPTLVVQDAYGVRVTLTGSEIALDGAPHTQSLPAAGQAALPEGEWSVVAVDVFLGLHSTADLISWGSLTTTAQLAISIEDARSTGAWDGTTDGGEANLSTSRIDVENGTIAVDYSFSVLGLSWEDGHLFLLSFPASTEVPVLASADLAADYGLAPGDRIALAIGATKVDAIVAGTVPYVPSSVREPAILADVDAYSRALLSAGSMTNPIDGWWVAGAAPGSEDAIRDAGWGPVDSIAETATALHEGPLRVPLRVAWMLTAAAAVALAVVGAAAHASAEAAHRASTIARLRAMGVSRRVALGSHLLQHATISIAAVGLGGAVGAVLSWGLGPLLVVAPGGARAIPAPVAMWDGAALAAVLGIILAGSVAVGVPAAAAVVRRSTVAALRAGDAT